MHADPASSMASRLGSAESKEIIGGLETSFTIPYSGSQNKLTMKNEETEVNNFQPNDDQGEVLSNSERQKMTRILMSKSNEKHSDSGFSTPRDSLLTYEEFEAEGASKKNVRALKSVGFRIQNQEVRDEFDAISKHSFISYTNSSPHNESLQNHPSVSSINNLKIGTSTSGKNMHVLENIPEVDENVSEVDSAPGYYGWDGYEARFDESVSDFDSWSSMPGCIPPWAKSVKKKYGLSPTETFDEDQVSESKITMQEKLENLMKKHKELMLLKRVESKKQLIVQSNKDTNEMDTIKMRAKNTKYYMAPLISNITKKSSDGVFKSEKISLPSLRDSNSLSITKKSSRSQAKKEISQVLMSLQKSVPKKKDSIIDHENRMRKEKEKCPKITLSDIREFVNMSPDERRLHEIIRIEKVPSVQDLKERGKPLSKYIINLPKDTITDKPTVNVIKIKEKRKLRVNSIENIEEKVTELRYDHNETRRQEKRNSDYKFKGSLNTEPTHKIKTKTKSPTETKTFEVRTRQTPLLAPIINEEEKKTDKLLLLQYDKNTKKDKHTTQLLGLKESCSSEQGEMYLYGSETEGGRVKESLAAAKEIPLTLKDKVHSIFEELRGFKLRQNFPADMKSAEVQASPSVDTKITQRSSLLPPTTNLTTVEAKPEVRSAAVQVQQSQIFEGKSASSAMPVAPHSTPTSDFQKRQEDIKPILDKNTLHELLEDLVLEKEPVEKPIVVDEGRRDETPMTQESIKEPQEVTEEEDQLEADKTIAGVENKPEESISVTTIIKEEESKTKLDEEEKVEIDVEEITRTISDNKLKGMDRISEDVIQETIIELALGDIDIQSKLTKDMSKEISTEKSKESIIKVTSEEHIEQLEEKMHTLSMKDEMRTLSITPSTDSENKSMLQTQNIDFNEITTVSKENEMSLRTMDNGEESDNFFKMTFPKEYEDIRSYEFGSQQGTELVIKSSSKFLHQKEDLRKKMNWTNDTIYLENNACPQLVRGLAETAMKRPADPIDFLAHWIYKNCESRERSEQEEVRHEHLQLARAMAEAVGGDAQTRKKFNVKKYTTNINEEEKQSKVYEEGVFPEDNLKNNTETNTLVQEA